MSPKVRLRLSPDFADISPRAGTSVECFPDFKRGATRAFPARSGCRVLKLIFPRYFASGIAR